MTAQASLQSAIRAVNLGATHYVQKPFENDELVAILRRSLDYGEIRRENLAIKEELRQTKTRTGEVPRPIGESPKFTQALELAESVAGSESTILIRGESGTGKEIFARYIHDLSPRSQGRFLSINCAALPESLLESELFGHVKGSFTGAVKDKEGLFVAAGGGSFFLDEVGEMAPSTQVKLLRVLQQREVVPVGATRPVAVDVRLIAATNRDLERDIETGRFRRDLYYRLNVIALELPPLRERTEDVPLLAEHFLERLAADQGIERKKLSKDGSELLAGYRWAGNVRELENVIERAVVLTDGATIKAEALPERLREEPVEPLVRDEPPAESDPGGDRAGVHRARAQGRGRQQDESRRSARNRPQHPLPQDQPLRDPRRELESRLSCNARVSLQGARNRADPRGECSVGQSTVIGCHGVS